MRNRNRNGARMVIDRRRNLVEKTAVEYRDDWEVQPQTVEEQIEILLRTHRPKPYRDDIREDRSVMAFEQLKRHIEELGQQISQDQYMRMVNHD